MSGLTSEDVSVFLLNIEEFHSADVIKRCICEASEDNVAFFIDDCYTNECSLIIEKWLMESEKKPLAFFVSEKNGDVSYTEVCDVEASRLWGIAFHKDVIFQAGNANNQIGMYCMYEFWTRLVKESGNGKVHCPQLADQVELLYDAESLAFVYAYVFRHNMDEYHRLNVTEKVYEKLVSKIAEWGVGQQFQHYLKLLLADQFQYERIATQTAPFLVLRGDDTCVSVLQSFADQMTLALRRIGEAVIEVGDRTADYDKMQRMITKGVVGFQAKALEIDYFNEMRGPKYQFWFDYPLHFEESLRKIPDSHYLLCQDSNYASLMKQYFGLENALQFSPGGIECTNDSMERSYDVVFIGSYFPNYRQELEGLQVEFYDYMINNPELTFEEGLKNISKTELSDDELIKQITELKQACRAVIGFFRNRVIETILQNHIEVHVYGDDWKKSELSKYPNLKVHPVVSMEESILELQKAKIGLNIMSWHKAGMTERIANIMLSGAVCVSEHTAYIDERLQDDREIVTFHLNQLDQLVARVKELLSNEQKRADIASAGYARALKEFTWKEKAKQLVALSEEYMDHMDDLRIFVATHVPFNPPTNPIYLPLHVGRSGKKDLGYLGDDSGENISELNFLYGELTGLYWIWQNVWDKKYVGLCHYRRYFINAQRQEMSAKEYKALLQECDAIVPKHLQCEDGCKYYEQYGKAHNLKDLQAVERALKRLYPEYADAYDEAMNGYIFYYGNLVVTSLEIMKAYAEWLFTIFLEASEEIDVSDYDAYHKRVYGFLSEQMFYVFALANHIKLCEVKVGVSAEKAETKELKEILSKLISEHKEVEAKKILDSQLKNRPDLLLDGSDINHELKDIYEKLSKIK